MCTHIKMYDPQHPKALHRVLLISHTYLCVHVHTTPCVMHSYMCLQGSALCTYLVMLQHTKSWSSVCVCCMQSTCGSYSYFSSAGASAIPGAPTPNPGDGNPALNSITIHWSAVEFTLSPLLYNVMYTLTRTNDSKESGSELVSHWTTHAKVSTTSTTGRRGQAMVLYVCMWTIQLVVFTSGVLCSDHTKVIFGALIDLNWMVGSLAHSIAMKYFLCS